MLVSALKLNQPSNLGSTLGNYADPTARTSAQSKPPSKQQKSGWFHKSPSKKPSEKPSATNSATGRKLK